MILDQNYWNTKWLKDDIIYEGRNLYSTKLQQSCDVRIFITSNESLLNYVLKTYSLVKETLNDTQLQIQRYVVQHIKYLSDEQQNFSPEFWQFPFETLETNIGDCEDGQILMQSLLIQQGIPNYRVKVQQGEVQTQPTQPAGGHGYCLYLQDIDKNNQEWKILDWCYYEDSSIEMDKKPLAKNGGYGSYYKETWFTFNNIYQWSQTRLKINGRITKEKQVDVIDNTNKQILFENILNNRRNIFKDRKPNLIK